jgi:hypothetical protein
MFWIFLNGNISRSSEIWKATTGGIIKIYYAAFVTNICVLELEIDFLFFTVTLADG